MLSVRGRKKLAVGAYVVSTLMVLGTAQLVGCAPEPAPAPSPTPAFASEDEAFAAAEEVYRAYNDAVNSRSIEIEGANPQQYLTGLALEGDIDAQNLLSSSDLRVSGTAFIETFVGESANLEGGHVTMTGVVCLDVSAVSLVDKSGADVTPPDRGETITQRVYFVGAADSVLISNETVVDGPTC